MPIKVDFNLLLEVYVKILKTTGMSSENANLGVKVLVITDMWDDPFTEECV